MKVLLGDLCLWAERYSEAAEYYHSFLTKQGDVRPTGVASIAWSTYDFEDIVDGYASQFTNASSSEILTLIPMENFNVIDLTGDDASLVGEYNGEMLGGKRNGYGICKYENGKVYLGEWKDNKYHGNGKLIYGEGDNREYLEGVFSEHKANGHCIFKFKNGDCYEGNMTDGKITGYFVYTQSDGYIYEGDINKENDDYTCPVCKQPKSVFKKL